MDDRKKKSIVLGIVGTFAFFVCWEMIARLGIVRSVMWPRVTDVCLAIYELFASREMIGHIYVSAMRAVAGFIIGGGVGIVFGIATARVLVFRQMTEPLLQMLRAIPSIAFVPLAIFWFGLGETSKLFLIGWGVFFPVWINTYLGMRDVDPLIIRASAALGASGRRMLTHVILPAALPFVIAGLRVSISIAFVLLVASEIVGAIKGVGYLIQLSQMTYRIDRMFVGLIFLGIMGFLADRCFVIIVNRLFPWYGAEERL
jgi:NitT/TauT family transport system permease protein/sulfonate transport system permease protein